MIPLKQGFSFVRYIVRHEGVRQSLGINSQVDLTSRNENVPDGLITATLVTPECYVRELVLGFDSHVGRTFSRWLQYSQK